MIKIVTSEKTRQELLNVGYEREGRIVKHHRCDFDYVYSEYGGENKKVEDFVLAYNQLHSVPGLRDRLDILVKWRLN